MHTMMMHMTLSTETPNKPCVSIEDINRGAKNRVWRMQI